MTSGTLQLSQNSTVAAATTEAFTLNAEVTTVNPAPCYSSCDTSNGCSSTCPSACTSGS